MKESFTNYFSGGVAHIVDSPTPLTFSFLSHWFSGTQSYGRALQILNLPYVASDVSIVTMKESELVTDLIADELILYQKTIFSYAKQSDTDALPILRVNLKKLCSPVCIANTIKSIIVQSLWIANPSHIVSTLQTLVSALDEKNTSLPVADLDRYISHTCMPAVIAVGYVSEYLHQYLLHELHGKSDVVNSYIASQVSKQDWMFQSLTDQFNVKTHKLSFDAYMDAYGIRADRDFELDCPRWKEIPTSIQKRIEQSENRAPHTVQECPDNHHTSLIEASIALQILRTTVKRKTLRYIDALRAHILIHTQGQLSRSHLSRKLILKGEFPEANTAKLETKKTLHTSTSPASGNGTPVSVGICTGIVAQISDPNSTVPQGTIGVFPNASPEFSILFPKCTGLIFARGGQTAHGAIVAREFGIPAIIEKSALAIPNGTSVELNGTKGNWRIV